MADLSALPALDVDPVGFGARQSMLQSQAQQAQQNLQAGQLDLSTKSQLAPLEIEEAKTRSGLEQISAANQRLSQVAKDAQAADPEDAPAIWDRGMQDAAAAGVKSASQYVGHYRPDLAERVGDIYGGGAAGASTGARQSAAGGTSDQQAIERAVAGMPPDKLKGALGNLDRAISAFNNVKDQQSWESELQALKDGGMDVSRFMPSTDWNPINYAAAARVIKSLVPMRDAMASRAALLAAGATPPAPAPVGTSQYIGINPNNQRPVYHNATTGQDTEGSNPIGPKPSAAISAFQFKQKAAIEAGMSSDEALQFANGRKALPPERLEAIALEQANRELGNVVLSGANIPNPDEWVRQKAAENFQILSSSAEGSGGNSGNKPPPPSALPQRAIDALKAAGGRPVRFNNNSTYRWDVKAGKPVQVQ